MNQLEYNMVKVCTLIAAIGPVDMNLSTSLCPCMFQDFESNMRQDHADIKHKEFRRK